MANESMFFKGFIDSDANRNDRASEPDVRVVISHLLRIETSVS
jgi:hypothetical protein